MFLVNGERELLEHVLQGTDALAGYLDVQVAKAWCGFGIAVFQYAIDKLDKKPGTSEWWTYLCVHKADNTLIGNGGYKGEPEDGMVEIGYEIAPDYRNQGFATEFAGALIDHAFDQSDVLCIRAHTLAESNASSGVLRKCGFVMTDEILDDTDGAIWRWELWKSPEQ